MNYTASHAYEQLEFDFSASSYLLIPSALPGFHNTDTKRYNSISGAVIYLMRGSQDILPEDAVCASCGAAMHVHSNREIVLSHLRFGKALTQISVTRKRFFCPSCGASHMQHIPYCSDHHRITKELEAYVCDLLALGTYTNKQVAELCGLHQHTVKAIDKRRLESLYVKDGKLVKPKHYARFLGIDEFKLHDGHQYATHIIDMATGHVLWIAQGKKKKVVYDFIEHVGMDWMRHVDAVALDMNSDFEEAFLEKCPHIRPVFDYFHLVKNFNDKVVSEVRKDEFKRLMEEGKEEEAHMLKRSRYILTANRETLARKDAESAAGKVLRKESRLFATPEKRRTGRYLSRYEELIAKNRLFLTADLVKEALREAYACRNESDMIACLNTVLDLCRETKNRRFLWFYRLIQTHFDGIVAHGKFHIANGRMEGLNQKIKTMRRHAYGIADDEYLFLKIMDLSRASYVRNPKSHKVLH